MQTLYENSAKHEPACQSNSPVDRTLRSLRKFRSARLYCYPLMWFLFHALYSDKFLSEMIQCEKFSYNMQPYTDTALSIARQNVVKVLVYFERLDYETMTTASSYSVSAIDILVLLNPVLHVPKHCLYSHNNQTPHTHTTGLCAAQPVGLYMECLSNLLCSPA